MRRNTTTPTATTPIARATGRPAGARRSIAVAAVTTPMARTTVRLTTYHSGATSAERSTGALQEIVDGVVAGRYRPSV